ncbi:MAG: thiazole synthase [Deltaproteobacteria bacterium]|nr:thiazole synthase [Deltaproteobacteria bacterium]
MFLGTAQYPSPEVLKKTIKESGAQIITASLRRQNPSNKSGEKFWSFLKACNVHLLPNTAGCRTAKEAIALAFMAREIFKTNWIKLEVIGDDYNLQPDPFELVEAARILCQDGFSVFAYTTEDLVVSKKLYEVGCVAIMPWASPIGSGQGILNLTGLKTLRARLPHALLIVDAGLGKPSEAARVMEIGFDGVLVNTAVANAVDPIRMACAFSQAAQAGRMAYEAGLIKTRDVAIPSTPTLGTPFWHEKPA